MTRMRCPNRQTRLVMLNRKGRPMFEDTVILYRPVGPKELALLVASGYKKWPPRLPEQPIFYPVTNEEYAREIAEKWNLKESGSGYVTKFRVKKSFMDCYEIHK